MKKHIAWFATTVLIAWSQGAAAQDSLVDYLLTACKDDLQQYCSQVTPGEGRLLHCVAAHEDKLSGQCEYALYRAASVLEQMTIAIAYVARECAADIEANCNGVEVGGGRMLACLEEHDADVSDGCKQAVSDTVEKE